MSAQAQYVTRVLEGPSGSREPWAASSVRTERQPSTFYRRGIDLEVVQSAFVLALARRTFRGGDADLEPIRCLSYFAPIVEELIQEPPLPEYLDYLRSKLVTAGLLQSA